MSVTALHIDDNVPPAGTEMDATRFAYLISHNAHSAADEQGSAEGSNTELDETEEADNEGGGDGDGSGGSGGGGGGGTGDDSDAVGGDGGEVEPVDTRVFLPLSSLRSLSLKGNGIRDPAASRIGEELASNSTLATLNLYRNKIGDAGGSAIFQALRLNRTLRSLNVGQNQIGDDSVKGLSEAVSELTLTHKEIVMRRKVLLSSEGQEALAAHAAAASGSAHDRDGGKKSSKPGGKGNHAHASAKGGKKDRVPSAGKRAKSGKPSASKGGKGGKSRGDGGDEGLGEVEPPSNPLLEVPRAVGHSWIIPGNRMLVNLNLSRNNVGDAGIAALQLAVQLQGNYPGGSGLIRCSLQGNRVQNNNADLLKIERTMAERDPYANVKHGSDHEEEE